MKICSVAITSFHADIWRGKMQVIGYVITFLLNVTLNNLIFPDNASNCVSVCGGGMRIQNAEGSILAKRSPGQLSQYSDWTKKLTTENWKKQVSLLSKMLGPNPRPTQPHIPRVMRIFSAQVKWLKQKADYPISCYDKKCMLLYLCSPICLHGIHTDKFTLNCTLFLAYYYNSY
jgi:hypothetical protein